MPPLSGMTQRFCRIVTVLLVGHQLPILFYKADKWYNGTGGPESGLIHKKKALIYVYQGFSVFCSRFF